MADAPKKRKGWRKQPTRNGGMRVSPSYQHTSGAKVTLAASGWYFVCECANGRTLNSLWREGEGRLFESAIEAMVDAERAMDSGEAADG